MAANRAAATPTQLVQVEVPGATLPGELAVPRRPTGVVVFAHGAGSDRHSPRNHIVAEALHGAGNATLLLDLGSERTATDRGIGPDVTLLTERLLAAVRWAGARDDITGLPLGLFGARTGAAVVLSAAVAAPDGIAAVVARGGRTDLVAPDLERVTTPTLLIVGGHDEVVRDLNMQALAALSGEKHLEVVPDATNLFEEPGAIERVGRLARDWFAGHFARAVIR